MVHTHETPLFLTKNQKTSMMNWALRKIMGNLLSKIDAELLQFVGETDFEILKDLSTADKEMIIKSAPTIALANSTEQFFWLGDKDHNTIYINDVYRKMTGYTLEEMVTGKYKSDHAFTKKSQQIIAKHHKLRTKGLSSQYEADVLTKDGKLIPVIIHGVPTESGGTIGLFSNLLVMDKLDRQDQLLLDIIGYEDFKVIKKHTKKDDQEQIVEVANTIRIANAMNQACWLGNNRHETIYCNHVYRELTEYSLEECLGQQSDFCFDEESKKSIAEHHKLRTKGVSSQYEASYVSKTGKKIPVLVIGSPTRTGGTFGIHVNMTEIKELSTNKQITDQIIRNSYEAIVVLDKNQHIKLWNQGAARIFGYEEEEVLNKSINVVIPNNKMEESDDLIDMVTEKKFIRNIETQRLTKTNQLIDVSISLTKVISQNNKFIGYLVIYRDISQQKKTNVELQKRFETIQDAYKELGLQKRQIDYLYEISNAAASSASLSSLSNLIVSAVCMLTKCDGTVLRLFDPKKSSLVLESCIGVSQKWLTKNQIPFENSLGEESVHTGRPLLIDNIQSSQKHKGVKLLKQHKFTTLILLPLLLPGKIIGTISLYSTDPAKFRFIETDFLENFAKQCALALYVKTLTESAKK
jgi:PAS domain S-box-containing protein